MAERKRVLITVTAYPLPSRSYDELVCTAGVLEDGSWIRIYPVPFKFLEFNKYQWVELDLVRRTKDFRPESYHPNKADLSDLEVIERLDTKYNWQLRREACLTNVYSNLNTLINDSTEKGGNVSLATFKPTEIVDFIIEPDEREWKKEWVDQLNQLDLFTSDNKKKRSPIRKVPYKFKYRFKDEEGKVSTLMIEDWEIGALYWNCLNSSEGDEYLACQKVKNRYFDDLAKTKDVHLFLGTTEAFHRRRSNNPFVIIGVFYPPHTNQLYLEF